MSKTGVTRPGAGRWAECKFCHRTEGLRWNETKTRLVEWQRDYSGNWTATDQFHTCAEYRNSHGYGSQSQSAQSAESAAQIMANASNGNGSKPTFTVVEPDPPKPAVTNPPATIYSGLSRTDVEMIATGLDEGWIEALGSQIKRLSAKTQKLDEDTARSYTTLLDIVEEIRQAQKNTIEVKRLDGTTKDVGRQHMAFADILFYLSARKHVFMVGPAGSGKSTAAEKAAEALGLPFYVQPMGPAMTDVRFLGYQDGNGRIVRTSFREAYEFGGVYCADEMDKCHAGTLTAINGAIANGHCGFPDGMVKRHKDFVMVAAANTWGHGATTKYIGATKLDGSTLNRFLKVVFDYDEEFERELVGKDAIGIEWVAFVQRIRRIVFQHKLEVIVSPRQSLDGVDLLRLGHPRGKVEAVTLWNDMSEDTANLIRRNL